MFCDQCGTENSNQNKYCGECGARLGPANGKAPEPIHAPAGPVSSAFRREVEQQQLRLQRLEEHPVRNYSDLATSSLEGAPDAETIVDRPDTLHEEPTVVGNRQDPEYPATVTESTYTPSETAYRPSEDTISGPSFLGLSGSEPSTQQDLSYLYDDDAHPGRARKIVALLIALGFIAFIAYEWKQNPNWQTTIVGKLTKSQANPSGNNAPPQSTSDQPVSAPGSAAASAPSAKPNQPPQAQASNGTEQAMGPSQPPASSPSVAAKTAGTDSGASGSKDTGSKQTPTEQTTGVTAETNSTGAAGEQEAVDNESADDNAKPAKSARDRLTANKHSNIRPSAAAAPAKTEDADEGLVKKADAYLYGRGVPRNCQQALVYLRTAANRGNATARSRLGGLYATGHCVPLDRAEAYNWFTLSRDAGGNNVWVQRNREILWSKMTADEKARAMEPPR